MRVVAFDLRQSTRELLLRDEAARRRGLQRAFIASLFCGQKGHAQLRALIFEGWILPNLASAPREPWRDLNRSMLLERACAAFVQSKEPLKLRALLEALILRGNDEQVQDWARIKLASLCVQEDRLREAVSLLRQVRAPSMKGSIRWAEEIEAQIKAQNKKPREEPPPVVPKS